MRSRILAGTAIALFAALTTAAGLRGQTTGGQPASALMFKTLFTFDFTDGDDPSAALVQGTDGNFYGTDVGGGAYNQGTIFKITPAGVLTTLYTFDGSADGNDPLTPLVLGTDGNFYGTTLGGGPANENCGGGGCGNVFKMTPSGALTNLYDFCQQTGCPDGATPGGLVQGSDGNFYGTTQQGGICLGGCGTVFKMTPSGALTTLYDFSFPGGNFPYDLTSLIQGTDGDFYGTTLVGGSGTACSGGCGTVFKITSQGVLTTLHNFTGTDGEGFEPYATLVQARDGNFYGTTGGGGSSHSCQPFTCGTVFKITPQGVFATLASLTSAVGTGPSGLVQAMNGNFYATGESRGGPCDCGSVFEVTPEGVLTRLHSFNSSSGGYLPASGLLQATNGSFYGVTLFSSTGFGSVFGLSIGLGPFVKSVPTRGKAGIPVKILGNNLDSATSVTFNGVAAAFTVESSTYIEATVPAGATTGPIAVTLAAGTLSSNVNFQVLP